MLLDSTFLTDRTIQAIVGSACSDPQCVNAGVVLLGCVLSSALFLLHANDMLDTSGRAVDYYADDSTGDTLAASIFHEKTSISIRTYL